MMNYEAKWKIVEKLGEGGQGIVHRVQEVVAEDLALMGEIARSASTITATVSYGERDDAKRRLSSALAEFFAKWSALRDGALKLLHPPQHARDPKLATERAAREISAMKKWAHPHLLKLLDSDADDLWYVSEFHPQGSLDRHVEDFAGKLHKVLTAIRPVVEAVGQLHSQSIIHRDIKPQNIFVNDDGLLVLGDFGLVCELEDTRITNTHSNVGSRDWMPGWAMSQRVDELSPAFDVFALGKVIWSMLSGLPVMPLWYYNKPAYDVARLFPDSPDIALANELFAKCIVEEEDGCFADANELLHNIDELLAQLDLGTSLVESPKRMCKVCHIGKYSLVDRHRERNFGLSPGGKFVVRLLCCDKCGHVQLFFFDSASPPTIWKDGDPFPRFNAVDPAIV